MKQHQKNLSKLHEEEDVFNRALRLRDDGQLEEASEILLDLAERHPDVAAPAGVLGGIYAQLGRSDDAANCFRRAVEINPRSELANRGLFHALWNLGEESEAIAVIRGYTELTGSDAFRDILESYDRARGKRGS